MSVFVPVPYCLDDCGFVVEPEVRQLMKSATKNIRVFFFILFLSHIYRELLSYTYVKLSILEIGGLVGCDVGLRFKLLNN